MAATIEVERHTGVGGSTTQTDVTGINTRLNAQDAHETADTDNPIQIPDSGTNYGYWATFRLNASVTPVGTVNNIKVYTDGSNNLGTGVSLVGAKASTGANSGYRQAAADTELTQVNHTGLDAAPADMFSYTSGSPLALTGSITNPSTGEFGDFLVMQIQVASTASEGVTAQETITFQYDET